MYEDGPEFLRCSWPIVLSQEVGINLSISNTHGLSNLKLMAAQFILL